ncbi:ATP-dependent DNA helicase [Elysia marginata]|uniref:ATP-dependent DNA helicase n=1 Tax=Elysia marginata TaxID=1093978 RepID=A0AAV4HFV4_9GAST|nr:ATP-dependent DNA helicase [Elysia marginata]
MQDLIGQLKSKTLNFMIIEDLNYHFDFNTSADAAKARDLLAENDLQQVVNFPTHKAQHVIDWVIAPKSGNSIKLIDVTTKSVSDHAIITMIWPLVSHQSY